MPRTTEQPPLLEAGRLAIELEEPRRAARARERLQEVFGTRLRLVEAGEPADLRLVRLEALPPPRAGVRLLAMTGGEGTQDGLRQVVYALKRRRDLDHVLGPTALDPGRDGPLVAAIWQRLGRTSWSSRGFMAGEFRGRQAAFVDSLTRDRRLDAISAAARDAGASQAQAERVRGVAEELLTNALYNTKAEAQRAPIDRASRLVVDEADAPNVTYGRVDRQFFLRVRDRAGLLTRDRLLDVLARCTSDHVEVDASRGGAGLGMWRIFTTASMVVIRVVPGESTEVLVRMELDRRRRALSEHEIHLFFEPRTARRASAGHSQGNR